MGEGTNEEPVFNDLIKYKGKVYEVPSAVLTGLIKTHPGIIGNKMFQYGVKDVHGDNITGCGYCTHFDLDNAGGCIEGEPGVAVNHCHYTRIEDVLWATHQENARTGEVVRLTMTPCAMYDARVAALAEYGALDSYLVNKPFDAVPVIEEMGAPADLVERTFAINQPRTIPKTIIETVKPRPLSTFHQMIRRVLGVFRH